MVGGHVEATSAAWEGCAGAGEGGGGGPHIRQENADAACQHLAGILSASQTRATYLK